MVWILIGNGKLVQVSETGVHFCIYSVEKYLLVNKYLYKYNNAVEKIALGELASSNLVNFPQKFNV